MILMYQSVDLPAPALLQSSSRLLDASSKVKSILDCLHRPIKELLVTSFKQKL